MAVIKGEKSGSKGANWKAKIVTGFYNYALTEAELKDKKISAPRETEDNAYAKFWGDKQRALWYVMVVSGVVNTI